VIDVCAGGIGVTDIGRAWGLDGVDFLRASGCLGRLRSRLGSGPGGARRRRSRLNDQRPAGPVERGVRWARRNPFQALSLAAWST